MRRVPSAFVSMIVTGALVLATAPAASAAAAKDLSGSWNSAARRSGGPGYSMKVISQSTPPGAYDVVLRFHYQDGRVGPRIKGGLTSDGTKVTMLLNGRGQMADAGNPNLMHGTVGQDGSIYFPTCYRQLPFITRKQAPQACLFQQFGA